MITTKKPRRRRLSVLATNRLKLSKKQRAVYESLESTRGAYLAPVPNFKSGKIGYRLYDEARNSYLTVSASIVDKMIDKLYLQREPSGAVTLINKVHYLKTWPEYFEAILDGSKTFEIRVNDRDYHSGDLLILEEYRPGSLMAAGEYTGRRIRARVTYLYQVGTNNLVALSIRPF